ncbi:peptidoglycan recognition protein family protein [Streptomyces neyagawaensis]|uniref:peptidoglycan recognition protein family protein n=1 Tax=Streptomyces neyagawaensis TaxID=42238 RepID=UPI0006E27F33|nr:N-acetylmuramoyl-L-alanine amidase [Streptomyces neyagawaensis]MCL6734367.1 N-acetylmuramoyl-L-alanine amidase [Streptomyces neyagawaensis]MDE1681996.1 N-acetylmuramoyl-L-alanine amidase [Streptomyces neyagawaensis]
MAWYAGAVRLELQPESSEQPQIRPTQLLFHTIVAPWDEHRLYAYWKNSTSLESHFGVDFDGSLGQYLSTTTRADANYQANRRPDGTGAISVESASNTKASDPWTDEQLDVLADLGVWVHRTHDVPLRACPGWAEPGFGIHRMFREWSPSGTACPGEKRAAQFRSELLPTIIARAGEPVPPKPGTSRPVVSLAHIKAAQRRDPGLPQGGTTYKAEGLVVEDALYRAGLLGKRWVDGSLGTRTRPAVSEWQERCGFRGRQLGQPADGYFGKTSLSLLGQRYGFDVKE